MEIKKYKINISQWQETIISLNILVDASTIITDEKISEDILGEAVAYLKTLGLEELDSISRFLHNLEVYDSENELFNRITMGMVDMVVTWMN